jgi:ferric-dicitrate binding protein FerR (iron transport regulator)
MNDLIDKYRTDELSPEELSELRKKVNLMTDEDIERQIRTSWMDGDMDISSVNDSSVKRIKNNVDAVIGRKHSRLSLLIRWSQIAAAVLLPVSILFAIYFYRENNFTLSEEMYITTGKAERASITLPDGTSVSLNTESKLGYIPKYYNKKERNINFSGEGYFQVHYNEEIPFFIKAKGLKVKVLGTTFNLSVREKNTVAELALEEGSVWLLSTMNSKNVVLQKNQKAILDYITGNITVITDDNINDHSAWRRGDMIFRNTELPQVIRTIEENYNMTILINCKECLLDRFTGTLPVTDLNEALEIIEHSYHLKAVINGKEIVIKDY